MKRNAYALSSRGVLLVDEALTVELYAGVLRSAYQVLTTSSLNDADEILTREHPEIVVVEPAIGGEGGWAWVKHIIQTYAIPTIICSALDDRKMGLYVGVSAYLIKPVPPILLSQTVADFFNKVP